MKYVSDYAPRVQKAIDAVVAEAGLKSRAMLARRMDVSRQAVSNWAVTGIVPTDRAMQMELISGGKVSWRRLCPDIVYKFNNATDVFYANSKRY